MAVPQGVDMTNALYNTARYTFITGATDWRTLDLRLVLISGTPNYQPADLTLADIVNRGGIIRGMSLPITGLAVPPDGTAVSDPVVVPEVPVGDPVEWMVLIRYNPVQSNSTLVYFIDDAKDLPAVPNGLDMVVQPDWLQQRGWFRL